MLPAGELDDDVPFQFAGLARVEYQFKRTRNLSIVWAIVAQMNADVVDFQEWRRLDADREAVDVGAIGQHHRTGLGDCPDVDTAERHVIGLRLQWAGGGGAERKEDRDAGSDSNAHGQV